MKTYRITFAKRGALIFVSHLDFSHSVVRALKRAELPLKYSEGFSPHPKLVFGLPLSVGMTGENELLDVTLVSDDISNDEFKRRFSQSLTPDIEIKSVGEPEIKLGKIKSADYTVLLCGFTGQSERIERALQNPPSVVKKTKSGKEKELDITPMLYAHSVLENENGTQIRLTLAASGDSYLNPELVITSLRAAGIDFPEEYDITREKINFGE